MSRALTGNVLLLMVLSDWLITFFNPKQNMGLWLAAAAGAFVIRFAFPKLPTKASVGGWVVGFLLACVFGPSAVKGHAFGSYLDEVGTWGAIALIGDIIIQVIAWIVRLSQKLGNYAVEHPGEAFDEGLERVEKVTTVWVRIKAPFLDLLQNFNPFKKS